MTGRPNILFVFPDQLSARWLPCYGNPVVQAPVLEKFAAQGVRFTRTYTNAPLCTPYRGCLFTGKYPSQTGVIRNGMALPEGTETLADRLNAAGYDTRYIGKWHLSGDPQGNRWVPFGQRGGFSHFIGWESHHVDHNQGLIWKDDPDKPIRLEGHETDGLTDIVCRELEGLRRPKKPFFMTVAFQAPHAPSSPPDIWYQRYGPEVMDGPPNTDGDAWFKNVPWNADYGVEEFRKRYFGEISQIDAAFGRILDALDRTGLADSTVVIFTSDHGDMGGCHGLFGKGVMHDESVRVPLLVRMPEQTGRICASAVSTVDLFPTLLELAGAGVPDRAEGTSFASYLNGVSDHIGPADVFIEYRGDCIIRDDLKLVTEKDSDTVIRCFDLAGDPHEMRNLSNRLPAEAADMIWALKGWRQKVRRH